MSVSGQRAYDLLKQMDFIHSAGTVEEKQVAELFGAQASELGLKARYETFKVKLRTTVEASLTVTAPVPKSYPVIEAYNNSVDTPEDGITAPLVVCDYLDAALLPELANKAVLVNEVDPELNDYSKSGIAALIYLVGSVHDTPEKRAQLPLGGVSGKKGEIPLSVCLHICDALDLVNTAASEVQIKAKAVEKTATSRNIIVDVPGTGASNETIVLGAHYDSVPLGPGAGDNGSGSVLIAELLRYFTAHPVARNLRFCWFGSEEIGIFGSKDYVKKHAKELDDVALMFNIDVAGGSIGRNVIFVSANKSLEDYLRFFAAEHGYRTELRSQIIGSDSTPFAGAGVPAVTFARGKNKGIAVGHSINDRYEYLSPLELERMGNFAVSFIERIGNADKIPFARGLSDDLQKEYDKIDNLT
jgi:hypothetical protein